MNAKTKILEIEIKLDNLDSDLDIALLHLNNTNADLAVAFEVDDANSIKGTKERVNARTYDVECLCEAKRRMRAQLPALRAQYTKELDA